MRGRLASSELQDWFQDGGGLIARWTGTGLFGGSAEVPVGLLALTPADRGLLEAGATLPDDAYLVRETDLTVPIQAPRIRDRNGFLGSFLLTIRIQPPSNRTAALLLRDQALRGEDRVGAAELGAQLEPYLRQQLESLTATSTWDGDGGVMGHFRREGFVESFLAEPLFERGLSLRSVTGFAVESETLEEHRQRESEVKREAERIKSRLEFLDLWKREEVGEKLAHDEVKKLEAHLEKEGVLREIEQAREIAEERNAAQAEDVRARGRLRRMLERERVATQMDIDNDRLELEIERAKKLQQVLEKHGLLAIVDQLGDSPNSEKLLELLVEREMTPEQISARARAREWDQFEERFDQLAQQLRGDMASGPTVQRAQELQQLDAVWVAAGLSLYRLSADGAFSGGQPTPVLPPQDIGYLRSVTVGQNGTGPVVLVGAQGGVGVYRPDSSHWSIHKYRPVPKGRGGANSVTMVSDCLLATHSEMGLHRWSTRDGNPSTALFADEIPPGQSSTRGVLIGPEGKAYFSHGERVYRFSPQAPHDLSCCGVLPDGVTALGAAPDRLMAGTRDGRLFLWQPGGNWNETAFRTSGPVFRITAPTSLREPMWIVGARQPAVHVLNADGELLEEYRSRYPIRWVAAGKQGVLGVDRFGQELLVWRWEDPSAPCRRIRVPDQIQYFAVEASAP